MSRRETIRETREDTKLDVKGEERNAQRIPLGAPSDIMTSPKMPGYVLRWINDTDSRVARALRGDYEFVTEDFMIGDKRVGTGRNTDGHITMDVKGGVTAYLMMIKEEYYEEDQKAKAQKVRQSEKTIRGRKDQPGMYGALRRGAKITQ